MNKLNGKARALLFACAAQMCPAAATLVEFAGESDIYRSSFVTKIEALGEDGSVVWTAAGAEPFKARMRQ
jgi:hypothetical protein